jgi:hypothetical protein
VLQAVVSKSTYLCNSTVRHSLSLTSLLRILEILETSGTSILELSSFRLTSDKMPLKFLLISERFEENLGHFRGVENFKTQRAIDFTVTLLFFLICESSIVAEAIRVEVIVTMLIRLGFIAGLLRQYSQPYQRY